MFYNRSIKPKLQGSSSIPKKMFLMLLDMHEIYGDKYDLNHTAQGFSRIGERIFTNLVKMSKISSSMLLCLSM